MRAQDLSQLTNHRPKKCPSIIPYLVDASEGDGASSESDIIWNIVKCNSTKISLLLAIIFVHNNIYVLMFIKC